MSDLTVVDTSPADVVVDTSPADEGILFPPTPGQVQCEGTTVCSGSSAVCCGTFLIGWGWGCSGGFACERPYNCDDISDCSGGQVCCTGTAIITGTINSSSCKASCGSDVQLCHRDSECPSGKFCKDWTPPDGSRTLGACQ
ncbi:MAG: hypothetical protein ACHREM_29515 [Polyangiales bacterium]